MAVKRDLKQKIDQVQIPTELHEGLSDFLASLESDILEAAARLARGRGPGPNVMAAEDIAKSAEALLPKRIAQLEQRLKQNQLVYVRDAS